MGGVGLKLLRQMNDAMIMKIEWNVVVYCDKFWVQVLRSKYGIIEDETPRALNCRNSSPLWRAMGRVWHRILDGIQWSVGDGEKVSFWYHIWVLDSPLIDYVTSPVPDDIRFQKISFFVDDKHQWKWNLFVHFLPQAIIL